MPGEEVAKVVLKEIVGNIAKSNAPKNIARGVQSIAAATKNTLAKSRAIAALGRGR